MGPTLLGRVSLHATGALSVMPPGSGGLPAPWQSAAETRLSSSLGGFPGSGSIARVRPRTLSYPCNLSAPIDLQRKPRQALPRQVIEAN